MVYICKNCGHLFSRAGKQDQCPDCGEAMLRSADAAEQRRFITEMAELIRSECLKEPRFPNLVETAISILNCFMFKLPATALQIDSGMIVDIVVEYGENSAIQDELTANIWAKPADGLTVSFLMPIHLPAREGEPPIEQINRIFSALNGNGVFKAKLFDFISRQLELNC